MYTNNNANNAVINDNIWRFQDLFCFSKFPWARERSSSKFIDSLGTRRQKGSPSLSWAQCGGKWSVWCFSQRERSLGTNRIGGLVGPRDVQGFLEKRESACPCWSLKFHSLANEPVRFSLLPGLSILCLSLTVVWTCKSHALVTCIPDRFWNRYSGRCERSGLALE
jgi:hypothetical protein